MRFAIAAGILLQTLPAISKPEETVSLWKRDQSKKKKLQALLSSDQGSNGAIRTRKQKAHGSGLLSLSRIKHSREGVLLRNVNVPKNAAKCNPNSSDADIGILSCGIGKYCMEDHAYDLGGVCVDSAVKLDRKLQEGDFSYFCDEDFIFDCDCSEFDLSTGVGTIDCLETYCFDYPLDTTCASVSFNYNIYADGNVTNTYCYDFFQPYEQRVCYSYTSQGDCTISFDGEMCDSCYENPAGGYCLEFDCTNTEGMHEGDSCEGDVVALILQNITFPETAPPVEPFLCPICGEGNEVTNPDGIVTIPTQPDATCAEIQFAAEAGIVTEEQCPSLQPFVTEPCECAPFGAITPAPADTAPSTPAPAPVMESFPPTDMSMSMSIGTDMDTRQLNELLDKEFGRRGN
jgi:hypothetical protein